MCAPADSSLEEVPATGGLLTRTDIHALAQKLGLRPTKTRGQNFVHDAGTVRRIVRCAQVQAGESVLEIGPGLGSLTLALLEAGAHLTAVEIDPVLAQALPQTVAQRLDAAAARLQVVCADALTITNLDDLGIKPGVAAPTRLVANLPYNVAVPILLTVLAALPSVQSATVMVQAEVADRLAAKPGSKIYGIPSVKTAWYARARRTITISRQVFWPVPNVDSALVELTCQPPPRTSATRAQVFSVVDAAFAQRRKTLRQALSALVGSATLAEQALRAAGIDPARRGETLTVQDFAVLAQQIFSPKGA